MKELEINNIITIGASAGGIAAVSKLLTTLPKDIDAAIFIVIHLSKETVTDTVLSILNKRSELPVEIPNNETVIKKGMVYLAPPDAHMMLVQGKILISKGAKENHWRPAIDVLFRTAAAAYDSCVTGIILTGLLDDGTSGMIAIKDAGGTCIVQEPSEAEFADMPRSVIKNIDVDYRVSVDDMGYILADRYSRESCKPSDVPERIKKESEITIRMASGFEQTSELGDPTPFTCPDCGGMLTKIEEHGVARFRCFTGHVFSENVLQTSYIEKTEETLWIAIRMMEERRNFLLSYDSRYNEPVALTNDRQNRASDLKIHIDRLKDLLTDVSKPLDQN
ncbi:chemotaxis protein CheB [Pedobacter endophyticus]|uniref:protein-glutamate methylesterase n=1 Tax=Pedobacter endophyticus TaxID=2789740 RepID=A0A7S9Q0S1_9SPHI|nr:chemotaxis protein CheB [Pedobacter endophyticus]QPH41270.1 chemotaxis protein CheB [Pedobacter endophyticus]